MINWRIGCSGFHYKHWKGSFYPDDLPQTRWFQHYCHHFNTLELNVSFYRFPRLSALENWYGKAPAEFSFAVKAPRAITHYKKFLGTANMLSDFYGLLASGLKEKLGCVLFQMPPNFTYSPDRLDRIIRALDNHAPNVLEFRHPTWWRDDVYKELAKYDISFCGMSHPSLPKEVVANTSLLYYRLHGEDQLYSSSYQKSFLSALAKSVEKEKILTDSFIFFNNDINANAVFNALEMKKLVQGVYL